MSWQDSEARQGLLDLTHRRVLYEWDKTTWDTSYTGRSEARRGSRNTTRPRKPNLTKRLPASPALPFLR
ncbi:hypothetical protein E2C01_009140 [Portunus trituberculatus]|uniref:Uncharacterized protein n=1 Tax=Portunus trituberculatus TaxID=210409 RepID=A0A5B7D440_PORTR|nr:hypothetical protein [Portunus trituberculatus]